MIIKSPHVIGTFKFLISLVYICWLQNADAVCSDVEPATLTQKHAVMYRNVIFSCLRKVLTAGKCAAVLCAQPDDVQVKWIQCENCTLWHHFVCAGITSKPTAIWFCAICFINKQNCTALVH